jgi:hypothetical protein
MKKSHIHLKSPGTILRPAREWEILNCRFVTQHYKMHLNILIKVPTGRF